MEARPTRASTSRPFPTTAVLLAAVVALGLVLRLATIVAGKGGLGESVHPGYDESVYVGAAWLVGRGALPYRDFVYVFPPGFLVLLWPVTKIASIFGGPALAVTLVRLLAALVGAINVWLVGRIGRRWMGDAGGIVAALVYATAPLVAQTEASALQEPFVNVFVLLAVVVWAARPDAERTTRRLIAAGLLVGAAVSIKLVAGMFLVPLLIAIPFARPVADRVRLAVAASLPLAVTGAVIALFVGWHAIFEQAFMAQVLRPQDGEGLSRVDSMLPVLRGQLQHTGFLSNPSAWIAVLVFVTVCAGAIWKGGLPGRLWGTTGLVVMGVLMASPSYFAHYGVLIAPTVALITGWVLTRAYLWLQDRHLVAPAIVSAGAILVVAAIGFAQAATTVDELPVGVTQLGDQLNTIVHDRGRPTAGAVSKGILHTPADTCFVAVRPQPLLDANRVPSADRHGHVLLDVYGSALVAARHGHRQPFELLSAAFPSIQREILEQSRDCEFTVFSLRRCIAGRKDITAATQRKLIAETRPWARNGCTMMRRRATSK